MNKYKIILFDLDGTLTDPKEGITNSVQYALKKMNIDEVNLDYLEQFIGPPLHHSFAEFYNFDDSQTKKAVEFYRERFKEKGMFENELYSGIPSLLMKLKKQEYKLVVATSKVTEFANQILQYFQLDPFFELVVGSHFDGTRSSKAEIIQYILNQYHGHSLCDFVMIGDRKYDGIGANKVGIDFIAVTYGYGSLQELKECEPTLIVPSVDQLQEVLLNNEN
ncbi:HAD family hydrolase [Lysinibacillus halotolerans]|uniref:HAD family hydrolase n=1 Tax=Lysinibacillus halotolerans TaxID=1368476 RepID=A0A3M8HFM9_9BACI|nr:HAD family hydrolase [Lysinibacillus halotolerans]RND01135.1 HAD family hydrolase [Lysinibacillus halotolerans]